MFWALTQRGNSLHTPLMQSHQSPPPRLKTSLWVEAHVRQCFLADMPAFIVAKGDKERGGVILKVNRFKDGIQLFEQTLDFDGKKMWRSIGEYDFDKEAAADELLKKKRGFDTDLWIVEIEDSRAVYELDAALSDF